MLRLMMWGKKCGATFFCHIFQKFRNMVQCMRSGADQFIYPWGIYSFQNSEASKHFQISVKLCSMKLSEVLGSGVEHGMASMICNQGFKAFLFFLLDLLLETRKYTPSPTPVFILAVKSLKAAAYEVKKTKPKQTNKTIESDLALCSFNIYIQVLLDTQYSALYQIVTNDLARNILNVTS